MRVLRTVVPRTTSARGSPTARRCELDPTPLPCPRPLVTEHDDRVPGVDDVLELLPTLGRRSTAPRSVDARSTPSRPVIGPAPGSPARVDDADLGVEQRRHRHASQSPRSSASKAARTISTFSCDIAYSDSPAASRASTRSSNTRQRTIFPRAACIRARRSISTSTPLASPRRITVNRTSDAVARVDELLRPRTMTRRTPRATRRTDVGSLRARYMPSSSRGAGRVRSRSSGSSPRPCRVEVASVEHLVRLGARSPRSPATSPTPTAPRLRGPRRGP